METLKMIQKGDKLRARFIGDSNLYTYAEVIERKGTFITAIVNNKTIVRKKVKVFNNEECVWLDGNYSFAPIYKLY